MFDKKEYYKNYYKNNKEKYLEWVKKYQQSEKGQKKIKEYRKNYYQRPSVKERQRVYDKNRYDYGNKLYRQINKQIRRCLLMINENGKLSIREITDQKYKILYGIDLVKIIEHLKPFPKNVMDYDLDHIIPIKSFNLTLRDQIKKAYSPNNLQLLLPIKNKKKSIF